MAPFLPFLGSNARAFCSSVRFSINLDPIQTPWSRRVGILPMNRLLFSSALLVLALAQNDTTPNGTVMSEGLKVRSMSRPVSILHISDTHSLHRSTGNLPDAATRLKDPFIISNIPRSCSKQTPTNTRCSRCSFEWSGAIVFVDLSRSRVFFRTFLFTREMWRKWVARASWGISMIGLAPSSTNISTCWWLLAS